MVPALKPVFFQPLKSLSILVLILSVSFACKKGPQEQNTIYSNDFESRDLQFISGGSTTTYNNSTVLGRYNKGGFALQLKGLPKHDLVEISFDLYIHDSWDGNDIDPGGPDIWKLEIEGVDFIKTTFSNKECPYICYPQSYPFNYLNSNQQPKNGAFLTDLPGFCLWAGQARGTTMYRIVKRLSHYTGTFSMRCLDELVQTNTRDQLCDEWIFRHIVRHDSETKYATHSEAKYATIPTESTPVIPRQSTPLC